LEIGIDCVEISQFNKEILSKKKLISKIFTDKEIDHCENKNKPPQHYAVRFAAKEAVIKALSCFGINITLKKIEILNQQNGTPFVKILDEKIDKFEIKISLTHSKNMAIAVAIITKCPTS
jgi:holo-[acyl-carrier protein] synthase